MIKRWTFYFDQENIRSDVSDMEEHLRIEEFVSKCPMEILKLPGAQACIYVNLSMVKCAVVVDISDEQLAIEKDAKLPDMDSPNDLA